MSDNEENYEDFVKRYRAGQGQPASGPRFSKVNVRLAVTLGLGLLFFLAFSAIGRDLDEAVAAQDHRDNVRQYGETGRNPWSKD